jgi:putative superfamily III holin-X
MAQSQERRTNGSPEPRDPELGDLIETITDDLRLLAHDEMELARIALANGMKRPIADGGAIVLGGVLALIGLGLLCTTVVAALQPVLPALWLRMLIMSVVYFAIGAALAATFMKRLRRDAPAELGRTVTQTVQRVRTSARALKTESQHD